MTVVDTIYDTIKDNWGGGGYGGATPSISSGESQVFKDLTTADAITVIALPHKETAPPVNDKFVNRHYTINVEITSKTTAAQLKLIVDETEYLLRKTAMTGVQLVRIDKDYFRPNQMSKWGCTMRVEVVALMSDGAVTSAAGAVASMQALLMYGASNAAWVPCALEGWNPTAKGVVSNIGAIENVDNTATFITYICPLPPLKGTLKLYIAATKIHINNANGTNYITNTYLEGMSVNYGKTTVDTDATDKNSAGAKTDTFASAYDCSSYSAIKLRLQTVVADALALSINNLEVQCYYA